MFLPPFFLFLIMAEQTRRTEVLDAAKEYFGEDLVDYQSEDTSIVIRFPEVKVSNERNKYTIVKELFAKLVVSADGKLNESPRLIRSRFSYAQWISRYSHSHLPRISGIPVWAAPCFGSGPILNTIDILSKEYDLDRWGLLFFELEKFVRTESLKGGPYIRLESIGAGPTCTTRALFRPYRRLAYNEDNINEMVKILLRSHNLTFGYNGTNLTFAVSDLQLVLTMSKVLIEAAKKHMLSSITLREMIDTGVLEPVILKDNTLASVNSDLLQIPENVVILTFKGEPQYLTVEDKEDNLTYFYVLNGTWAALLANTILTMINTYFPNHYGRTEQTKIEAEGKSIFL